MEIMQEVFPGDKLNRFKIEVDPSGELALQNLFNVDIDVAKREQKRIEEERHTQEQNEGFSDEVDSNSLYQFYMDGWKEPIQNFQVLLQYIN